MPPIPDLVRLSKLDTQVLSPEYTIHIRYASTNTYERRKVRKLEKWKHKQLLGCGSFGEVSLEECTQGDYKGELRAVKKVQKLESNNYHRELEAIALFSHSKYEQCFVKSFGWYDNDGSIFITMEYLPNGDLQKYLGSPLPESEGQNIVSQVLEGLDFMHQNGFAHRDLKPANILVMSKRPDWWVKIADFGISKRAAEQLTVLRTLTGTPAFAAPEVLGFIQSDLYTNAVDMWSLGVIAFLILTGEILFKDQRLLGQYVAGTFEFPSESLLANKVNENGCNFIRSLMAPRSEDRPGAEESLRNPWLSRFTVLAPLESQRKLNELERFKTLSFDSGAEASASWSTQEQPFAYRLQSSMDKFAETVDLEVSTSVLSSVPVARAPTSRETLPVTRFSIRVLWLLGLIASLILTGEVLFKDQHLLGQFIASISEFPSQILLANKVNGSSASISSSVPAACATTPRETLAVTQLHIIVHTVQKAPTEAETIAKAQLAIQKDLSDLRKSFAMAADEVSDKIEIRLTEIADRFSTHGALGFGAGLLVTFKQVVISETKHLKSNIRTIVRGSSGPDDEKAREALMRAVGKANITIRDKAELIEVWRENCYREMNLLIGKATEDVFTTVNHISDRGLQKIGMGWTKPDGVTFTDWAKGYAMKIPIDKWREDIEEAALTHPGLAKARVALEDIVKQALEIASGAAKELLCLTETGRWKLNAEDSSADFSLCGGGGAKQGAAV